MALTSPGVQVSVIDESFYTPAEPGTTPLIIVVSRQDKTSSSGSSTAAGTTKANAGKIYRITSQRELADTFGDPVFETDASNNPVHAGELNEYGLQAAYSFLGVSNSAYVVRADVDLGELAGTATIPEGEPADGQLWLDTALTKWGIQEWNGASITTTGGQTFTTKTPAYVLTESSKLTAGAPKQSIGKFGDYAVVAYIDQDVAATTDDYVTYWYKNRSNNWVQLGSGDWQASWPAVKSSANPTVAVGNIVVNGQTITTGGSLSTLVANINANTVLAGDGITAASVNNALEIYINTENNMLGDSEPANAIVMAVGTAALPTGITAGTYYGPKMQISTHTSVPEFKTADTRPRPTGSVWIKTTTVNNGMNYRVKKYSESLQSWVAVSAPVYADAASALADLDAGGGGANLDVGTTFVQSNAKEHSGYDQTPADASFFVFNRVAAGATEILSGQINNGTIAATTYVLKVRESVAGSSTMSSDFTYTITCAGTAADAATIAAALSGPDDSNNQTTNLEAEVTSANKVIIRHKAGGELHFKMTTGNLFAQMGLTAFDYTTGQGTANLYNSTLLHPGDENHTLRASNWKLAAVTASPDAPTTTVADGRLWYSNVLDDVDLMVHDGTNWVGYLNEFPATDPNGPQVSATQPTVQSDGTALVTNDLWIDTSDIANYPVIKRYNASTKRWTTLDNSDQTTENGVEFADARWGTDGTQSTPATILDLLTSDFLDPDAPDPDLYPKGMLLWNTRRSGFNVKRYVSGYIDTSTGAINTRYNDEPMDDSLGAEYYPDRWVTESANQADGSGSFGTKAQRKVIVQRLQAAINSNEDLRDDNTYLFNLIATPGYPELIGEMITLNVDRGITAFVIGDAPMTLPNDSTSLLSWSTNALSSAQDDSEGLVTRNEYLGVFYPAGFTSDNFGNDVVVPPSHMILRQFALSDQVSYPWFAPAGTRRGNITNATSVGYVNAEGEFVPVALNEGQRDTLYENAVNPIVLFTGAGLVNFGQKTRAANASALDRINVARLVIYLRGQLNKLAKPYIFEPNDKITRDEIKQQVETLLVELVGLRAIYDFLVVCDDTNNTPTRIDRNELYVDIAIEPVKAVEFIYIPLRLKNTGEIAGL